MIISTQIDHIIHYPPIANTLFQMCVDQRCVAVSSVIKAGCPHKCGINGECNNLGKCHCKVGFDPPHCQHFGAGGSEDGGPASDPDGTSFRFVVDQNRTRRYF